MLSFVVKFILKNIDYKMKLIYCKQCGDVVRLIDSKWRMCECKKSGGQYNEDLVTATVGGDCWVIGIPNPFFNEVFQHLSEPHGKQWFRNTMGYGGTNTSDCWYGEFPGDKQIFRIKSARGPKLKTKIVMLDKPNIKIIFDDQREYTVAGEKPDYIITQSDFNPSFKLKSKKKK